MYFVINYICSLLLLFFLFSTECNDIRGFDDSILFNFNWYGASAGSNTDLTGAQPLVVTSAQNEKYSCWLPNIEEKEDNNVETYNGPSAVDIVRSLFAQSICSFRLESYWSYEVCHGRFIRQYHEEREGKKVKLQEYYLGRWDKSQLAKVLVELKNTETEYEKNNKNTIPTKKIDGVQLPYLEVTMEDGSVCDLNNKPRQTKVLYVCYTHGKNEVYSLKETSTCVYEVIVLTSALCSHPRFRPRESSEHIINCLPLEGAPIMPRSLIALEAESLKLRHQSMTSDEKFKRVYAVFKVDKDTQDGEPRVRVEIHPVDVFGEKDDLPPLESSADTSPVENFLAGKNCLNGGSGWWKYEFCYGRSVEQYHIEKDGSRTSLNLGRFDKEAHLEWIEQNPHKRPKPLAQRKQLSHFYSGGTVCDKTGKSRQTEVKLKCLENSSSPGAVQLYLLEPKYCEYILGVESPLICDILARADDNGLVKTMADLKADEELTVEEEQEMVKAFLSREAAIND